MSKATDDLLAVMRRLRDPETGCAWDLAQNFATIAPYTIEEAYEVADAIERGDHDALRDELGDLLLQVVFHAQIATDRGMFSFEDVARMITDKMVRRHPHVFSDASNRPDGASETRWEALKAAERAKAARGSDRAGALDGVALALPALLRAVKLQKRAARVGFDWARPEPILDKIEEEISELRAELDAEALDQARLEEEFGDVLFACANLARRLDIDPEAALRSANAKFERRFRAMEARLAQAGDALGEIALERWEAEWNAVKQEEETR